MPVTRRGFIRNLLISGSPLLLNACDRGIFGSTSGKRDVGVLPKPSYFNLEEAGLFQQRIDQAFELMESCTLCPRKCGANRRSREIGFCRGTDRVKVHSYSPHFGEEHPLSGRRGSGTIFFSHCNLRCVFCQNWPIAHEGHGRKISDGALADNMLYLQRIGCHNINVVTPTHFMPNILNATRQALRKGLHLPLCYNSSGYESAEVIRLLDGIVDIYLPDMKYMDGDEADRYAVLGAKDYPKRAAESILEMHRQVGDLVVDSGGIAVRGLMIRHLVMPNRIAGTREFVRWVAEFLSRDTYVNIMSQYRVEHEAFNHPRIARAITPEEFLEAVQWAEEAGLRNLDPRSLLQRDMFQRRLR